MGVVGVRCVGGVLCSEGGESWHCCLEKCGCLIPGGAQGHGWGLGQPDPVLDAAVSSPACSGGLELDDL